VRPSWQTTPVVAAVRVVREARVVRRVARKCMLSLGLGFGLDEGG
jgi:hypothetical protein